MSFGASPHIIILEVIEQCNVLHILIVFIVIVIVIVMVFIVIVILRPEKCSFAAIPLVLYLAPPMPLVRELSNAVRKIAFLFNL